MQPDQSALEAIRRKFYVSGLTVTDWAREHGFERHLVYSVLSGRSRAQRGECHRIAVALGLKQSDGCEPVMADVALSKGGRLVGANSQEAPMEA